MNWLNCFSGNRFGVETSSRGVRTEFERDFDRLIFSSAFRRLQNKTQVFPLPQNIFVHNRLTHSLEVASVGRSLGKIVGNRLSQLSIIKNVDEARRFYRNHLKNVIAAACLAHDLGNPAFGHSGEDAISKYFLDRKNDDNFKQFFKAEEWGDLICFEGNANALRILTKRFNNRLDGGYRLTYSTLASILKYPCESSAKLDNGPKHRSKYGFFQDDKASFIKISKEVNMIMELDSPIVYYRHPFVYLVEAADDICYNIIDFEDAHRLGILYSKEVEDIFLELLKFNESENLEHIKKTLYELKDDPNESIAYLRAKCINFLTLSTADAFIENQSTIIQGTFNNSLMNCIEDIRPVMEKIEAISKKLIYNHDSVVKIELAGFKIMTGLIEDFVEAALASKNDRTKRQKKILTLIPTQYLFEERHTSYQKVMSIMDYMSGMTDNYALQLYRNLRGIDIPDI